MKIIFVDYLNLSSFLKILFINSGIEEVKILSNINSFSRIWIFLLRLIGFKVNYEKFFFGDIFDSTGESLYLVTRKIASIKSLEYSKWLLNKSSFEINKKKHDDYKKSLELYISKTVWSEMEYYIRRVIYVKHTYKDQINFFLLVKKSKFINKDFLKTNYNQFHYFFYGNNLNIKIKKWIIFYLKKIIGLKNFIFQNKKFYSKKSIFTIAVDTIDLDSNDRHFPNWYKLIPNRDLYILNFNNYHVKITKNELKNNNINIINNKKIFFSTKKHYNFRLITNKKIPLILKFEIENLYFLTNGLYYFLKKFNCEKFIFEDPQDPISDAVQIVSKDIGIQTICLQFSNMGMTVPLVMTLSDIFLSFSNSYKKVFTWNNLKPKRFYPIGYSFINKSNNSLNYVKKNLNDAGVDTIISYFDESVENHKWGLISEEKYYKDLEFLAKTVLKFKKIAIILKPQFAFNTIKKNKSRILKKAISSGRFLELIKSIDNESVQRNKFTPCNVAQISDYCISNLIGATAGLECALSNKKVILINPYGFISEFNLIYDKSKVIYPSLDSAIDKIITKEKKIGDWSKIINHFSNDIKNSRSLIYEILSNKNEVV